MAYSYNIKRKKRLPYLLDTDDAAKDHMALAAQAAKGGGRPYQDAVIQSAGPTPKGREYAASQYGQDPAANAPPAASGAKRSGKLLQGAFGAVFRAGRYRAGANL